MSHLLSPVHQRVKMPPRWRPVLVSCARHNPASCPLSSTPSRPTLVGRRRNLPFSTPFLSHQPYFPVAKVRHLCKGYMGCHIKTGAQPWQGTFSEVSGGHKHRKVCRDLSNPASCPKAEIGSSKNVFPSGRWGGRNADGCDEST